MIQSKLAVCAETIVRDAETNAVSIFNIIEEIGADQFPVVIPRFSSLFLVQRSNDDREQIDGTVVFTVADKELARAQLSIDFQGKRLNRVTVVIHGLVLEQPGNLEVKLEIDGEVNDNWIVPVNRIEAHQEHLTLG
ncbi:MAG: hypothetical protein M3R24_12140 [Chloroflexota bacterium]|nr:hypothetical protein [Chloroflexota bacterium]